MNTITLKDTSKDDDVFGFDLPSPQEIENVFLLNSILYRFEEYVASMRKRRLDKLQDKAYMVEIQNLLKDLVFFVTQSEEKNAYECEGLPRRGAQKALRELHAIEILCDMLYYPFKLGLYRLHDLNQTHIMTRICWLIYRVLKHAVLGYRINEFYVAQWLGLFFQ